MKIVIETVPHSEQRHPMIVGDWVWESNGDLTIKVSDMGNWQYEVAVGLHEAVEALLCKQNGVSQTAVDQFDLDYERDRLLGFDDEPGDDPTAPYHREHCFATAVERMLIAALGVSWADYDQAVESLP